MRIFNLSLAVVVLLPWLAACSSGSGSGSGSSSPSADGPNEDAAGSGPCYSPLRFTDHIDRYAKTGLGTFTDKGADETHELKELACMTVRDAQGKALGYAVSFGNRTPDPDRYVVIETKDYVGDGLYSADTFGRWEGPLGTESFAVTLTVSRGGKHGVVEDNDGNYSFEYDCDPSDDTAPTATSALREPAPGTAHVTTDAGEVYVIDNIECSTNPVGGAFRVDLPEGIGEAFNFEVNLPESKPGKQSASLWFNYYNIGKKSGARGTFAMSCDEPITGSFQEDSAPYYLISAKFTCPHR